MLVTLTRTPQAVKQIQQYKTTVHTANEKIVFYKQISLYNS